MTIAGKHLDAVMGIDTHIVAMPSPAGAPIPTPLPNPYVGIVMDPFDYAPIVGATVFINGLPRATAGTDSIQITPHLPLGGPLVPPPTGEGSIFMGSATVATEDSPQAFLGMPVLTCQSLGMPAPLRRKGSPPKSLVLPTSTLLATPMGLPVLIGGPPTIDVLGLAQGAAQNALAGKLGKMIRKAQRGKGALGRAMRALTRRANAAGEALVKRLELGPTARNRIARAICTITGHPVDVATGKVFTDRVDLTLPGPIPFELERVWYSTSTYRGPLGHGWHGGIYDHKLSYDDAASITTVTNSLGHKTQYEHRDGLVIRSIDAHGGVASREYDEDDRLLASADPLGQVTRYSYDERGNTLSVTHPDGACLQMRYDAQDRCVQVVDAIGGSWQYEYDALGRLRARIDPLGQSTGYRYAGKRLQAIIDPAGRSTYVAFDASGNLTRLELPDGAVHRFELDRLGRLVVSFDPAGNRERRMHDLLGRITRIEEPDGNVRTLAYDPEGNVIRAHDAHHEVAFTYQGMGRLASRREAGTTVTFEYDTEEQLTGITNEHGHVYRFELDATGAVHVESGFDGVRRMYQRDLAGRMTHAMRASGLISQYRYDAAGRVIAVEHSDGTREQYAYRPDGTLTQARNPSSTLVFVRDALGRIVREIQGKHWIASQYDACGHRTRLTSSLGADQHIRRNAAGDVTGLTHRRKGYDAAFEVQFARDVLGLETERSLPGGLRNRWKRDSLGRPLAQQLLTGNLMRREREYRWDVGDRLRALFDSPYGSVRYGHDRLGNLAFAQYDNGGGFELRLPDAVGNLFRREDRRDREYGPAGQLLKSVDARGRVYRYSYDAEGHLIRKTRDDTELWQYRWGGDGTLAAVVRPDGSEVRFTYDALGRRISKTYRGQTTRWVWDGDVPLHEWLEAEPLATVHSGTQPPLTDLATSQHAAPLSALLTRGPPERGTQQQPITWLFEPESFTPLAKLVGDQQLSIITDHLGVPIAMHDASGVEVWSGQLGIWGQLRRQGRGIAEDCPFRWPGQYEDVETGLYYNRFRYYDPEAGQYVSQDPIGLAGGTQLVAYVHDPLAWSDPLGLSACGAHAGDSRGLGLRSTLKAIRTASESYKGTTRLGHALSKHAGRNPDIWGKVTGHPSTWHQQGMQHVREILRGPGEFQRVTNSQGTSFLEKTLSDGRGVRLQLDYRFKGFID